MCLNPETPETDPTGAGHGSEVSKDIRDVGLASDVEPEGRRRDGGDDVPTGVPGPGTRRMASRTRTAEEVGLCVHRGC